MDPRELSTSSSENPGWWLTNGGSPPIRGVDGVAVIAADPKNDFLIHMNYIRQFLTIPKSGEASSSNPTPPEQQLRVLERVAEHTKNQKIQFIVGLTHLNEYCQSFNVARDPAVAAKYLHMAAAQNHYTAKIILALQYKTGYGVEKNLQKCLELFPELRDILEGKFDQTHPKMRAFFEGDYARAFGRDRIKELFPGIFDQK